MVANFEGTHMHDCEVPIPTPPFTGDQQWSEGRDGQGNPGGQIIIFAGPNPNCIDINRHLGLGF